MDWAVLIRRMKKAAPEAAFFLLLGAGVVIGGPAALAGLANFLDAALPHMQVQASTSDQGLANKGAAHGVARLILQAETPAHSVTGLRAPVAVLPPRIKGPVVAICIDDLGEDLAGTDKAIMLPKEVALSFLPYAEDTPFLARAAGRRGHLILAHVPMQALSDRDPGPMALKPGMSAQEVTRRLGWNLSRVPGLAGINNHEGSRFTADPDALAPVMAMLRGRDLFFFDSRTGPVSGVAEAAARAGVMSAERDVFLDDDRSPAAVRAQLARLVREAKRKGVAIAIGHPHDVTLRLLAEWLKQDHGVTLVPLDQAIRMKAAHRQLAALGN
jgi:polysaccharide deacetylase 2 family uncharacterized protein YibQ